MHGSRAEFAKPGVSIKGGSWQYHVPAEQVARVQLAQAWASPCCKGGAHVNQGAACSGLPEHQHAAVEPASTRPAQECCRIAIVWQVIKNKAEFTTHQQRFHTAVGPLEQLGDLLIYAFLGLPSMVLISIVHRSCRQSVLQFECWHPRHGLQ